MLVVRKYCDMFKLGALQQRADRAGVPGRLGRLACNVYRGRGELDLVYDQALQRTQRPAGGALAGHEEGWGQQGQRTRAQDVVAGLENLELATEERARLARSLGDMSPPMDCWLRSQQRTACSLPTLGPWCCTACQGTLSSRWPRHVRERGASSMWETSRLRRTEEAGWSSLHPRVTSSGTPEEGQCWVLARL